VQTSQGRIDAGLVVLTGGPKLAEVGRLGDAVLLRYLL